MAAADYRIMTDATGQRIATALEAQSIDKAAKTDLTSIIATGTTNATGATIMAGTYFYLNGALVQAKADIASGATFTSGTNYEAVTAGGLNDILAITTGTTGLSLVSGADSVVISQSPSYIKSGTEIIISGTFKFTLTNPNSEHLVFSIGNIINYSPLTVHGIVSYSSNSAISGSFVVINAATNTLRFLKDGSSVRGDQVGSIERTVYFTINFIAN